MSRNVRMTTVLTAQVRQLLDAEVSSLLQSCPSRRLDALTDDVYALAPTSPVPAAVASLLNGPAASTLAERAGVADQLAALRSQASHGSLLNATAAPLLATFADAAADLERLWTADLVMDAIREDLAVDAVLRADGAAVTGIEAWRDQACLLIAIEPGGGMLIDHADATGACGDTQRQLEQALTRRGLNLTHVATDEHDQDTGPLVTAAAAVPGTANLAAALADHAAPSLRRTARDRDRQHSGRLTTNQPTAQLVRTTA